MHLVSRLMLLSIAGLIGCSGASRPAGHDGNPEQEKLTVDDLAPRPSRSKNKHKDPKRIHPQSPDYVGGLLVNFLYFHAEASTAQPATLPGSVLGHHDTKGDVEIKLNAVGEHSCGSSGPVPIYEVLVPTREKPEGLNPCAGEAYVPGPDETCQDPTQLDGRAIAIPGAWDKETGVYYKDRAGKPVFTLSCMTGIAAKCVNWGYPPWGQHGQTTLSDYFIACTHAARAEYKSGRSYTCQGTQIDVYDRLAIEQPDKTNHDLKIEAAWGKGGLICMGAPRFAACETEVQPLPDCDEKQLSWDNRASWPPDVLLVTRSTNANATPTGACPKDKVLCSSLPGAVSP
ncbi:ADYC domain-containing protein [Sorangium sp. So ce136]|uniref:ADYC domain-containing protein n=1 Tax=Sorangium sp. So ce136 TaxID=3133284 RepID=UPI003F06617C